MSRLLGKGPGSSCGTHPDITLCVCTRLVRLVQKAVIVMINLSVVSSALLPEFAGSSRGSSSLRVMGIPKGCGQVSSVE